MPPIPSPIICNNSMDKKFLLRVEKSNECGSVTINKVFNAPLRSGAGLYSAFPAACKTPVTFIDLICPNNHPQISKESRNN